jgi:hypothetical protein
LKSVAAGTFQQERFHGNEAEGRPFMSRYRLSLYCRAIIHTIVAFTLVACSALPPDIQKDIESWFEGEVKKLVEKAWQDFQQQLEEAKDAAVQRGKEWLGWEAPVDAGVLDTSVSTSVSASTIKAAFADAYKKAGGGRKIGWPIDKVKLTDGLLVQYYEGGDHKRSVIAMHEDEAIAYLIPGNWLTLYEALGGPSKAGYPASNPERWETGWWEVWNNTAGRGERQLYIVEGETYALMKANDSESVRVVPPQFWKVYEDGNWRDRIGYPVSSYPLNDAKWQNISSLSAETQDMLTIWSKQPYRVMLFQHGSIIFTSDWSNSEALEAMPVTGGGTNLLLGVGRGFKDKYEDMLLFSPNSDQCAIETFRHAKMATVGEATERLLTDVAFLPLESTLIVVTAGTESIVAKVGLTGAEYLLELAHSEEPKEDTVSFVAGLFLDSFFSKAVGDFLSQPLSELTVEFAKQDFEKLYPDRLSEQVSLTKSATPGPFSPTMNVKVATLYDPLTHMASGIVTSDCLPDGLAYQFRVDPETAYPVQEGVWAGPLYWNLKNGKPIK